MSSGKYGAVSGAVARMQMLENISEHLAAAKTPGYKKGMVTFEAKLGEATSGLATKATNYSRLTKQEIDFTAGHIEYSGDTLDLAINGEGFFQIQRPDGSFGYTRKGNFQLNGEGRLVDTNGFAVMDAAGERSTFLTQMLISLRMVLSGRMGVVLEKWDYSSFQIWKCCKKLAERCLSQVTIVSPKSIRTLRWFRTILNLPISI